MKINTKILNVIAGVLFCFGIIDIITMIFDIWGQHAELLKLGGPRAVVPFEKMIWKLLLMNMAFPFLLCSFSLYIIRNKFNEKKQIVIRYILLVALLWFLISQLIMIYEIILC